MRSTEPAISLRKLRCKLLTSCMWMRMRRTPNARRMPEERRIGKKARLIAIQGEASNATALQKTIKIPHKTKIGKVSAIFFLEKENKTALEKDFSISFQFIQI